MGVVPQSQVAIRRRADGMFKDGNGQNDWGVTPRFVASRAKAITIIRVDLGGDLADFEIVTRAALNTNAGVA